MSTFDTVLTITTLAMFVFLFWVGKLMVAKGTSLSEATMDICAVLSLTMGDDHRTTAIMAVVVAVGMVIFNYFWPVPVYTTLFVASWVLAWAVQICVRLNTGLSFGSLGLYGLKAAAVFMK